MTGYDTLSADAAKSTDLPLASNLRAGITLLWQAYVYAQDVRVDLWDFALEVDKLYAAGLTVSDLRWLVAKRLAAHGSEISVSGDAHRSFRPGDGLRFEKASCLVFTPEGVAYAKRVLQNVDSSTQLPNLEVASVANEMQDFSGDPLVLGLTAEDLPKPHWDRTKRELCLAEAIVKRFRVPAPNQETILSVFEEEGWPEQIDDPLPFREDIDPRTRLHDAINRLNGCQTEPLLRFHGNGSGTGVIWELRTSEMWKPIGEPTRGTRRTESESRIEA